MKIVHSMGLYPNGSVKHNGVQETDLENHVAYNLSMRPGRALFVDGKCVYRGIGVSDQSIALWGTQLTVTPMTYRQHTQPYQ